ncbi:unnamed protein product, partial [Allacma fusca]
MWNNDSFGGRGGGFVPSDGKSLATGDKQQSRIFLSLCCSHVKRSQNIFPMAIRQLQESQDDVMKIHDKEVPVITIVGLVKSVEHSSTKTSYVIDDQSGTIDAVTYVGTDDGDSKAMVLMENTYGRVTGSLRTTKGEVLQVAMKLKKLKEQQMDTTKVGLNAFRAAVEFLSAEGHVYSTTDDEHYKCADCKCCIWYSVLEFISLKSARMID